MGLVEEDTRIGGAHRLVVIIEMITIEEFQEGVEALLMPEVITVIEIEDMIDKEIAVIEVNLLAHVTCIILIDPSSI